MKSKSVSASPTLRETEKGCGGINQQRPFIPCSKCDVRNMKALCKSIREYYGLKKGRE